MTQDQKDQPAPAAANQNLSTTTIELMKLAFSARNIANAADTHCEHFRQYVEAGHNSADEATDEELAYGAIDEKEAIGRKNIDELLFARPETDEFIEAFKASLISLQGMAAIVEDLAAKVALDEQNIEKLFASMNEMLLEASGS